MPLDGNLPQPDLKSLSTILRDRRTWPKDFEWDYRDCSKCAMGLAHKLYSQVAGDDTLAMAKAYNLPFHVVDELFIGYHPSLRDHFMTAITPEMVADAIDQYLTEVTLGVKK